MNRANLRVNNLRSLCLGPARHLEGKAKAALPLGGRRLGIATPRRGILFGPCARQRRRTQPWRALKRGLRLLIT